MVQGSWFREEDQHGVEEGVFVNHVPVDLHDLSPSAHNHASPTSQRQEETYEKSRQEEIYGNYVNKKFTGIVREIYGFHHIHGDRSYGVQQDQRAAPHLVALLQETGLLKMRRPSPQNEETGR
jgi:hypothetical protein